MSVAPESGRNRIMIYGPKIDGTYIVEFMTADGEALAISVPVGETREPQALSGADAVWVVRAGRGGRYKQDAVNAIHHQSDNHPPTGSRLGNIRCSKPNTKPNTF